MLHTHLSRWRTVSPILENAAARRVSGKPVQRKLRHYFKGSANIFTMRLMSVTVLIAASVNQCHVAWQFIEQYTLFQRPVIVWIQT